MDDNHTGGRIESSQQKENEGQSEQKVPIPINWGAVFAIAIGVYGIIASLSGHWREWWVISAWPIGLVLAGLGFFQWLKNYTNWNDDNVFIASVVSPLVLASVIGFAYIACWPTKPSGSKSEPSLEFSLHTTDSVSDSAYLTNDFLVSKRFIDSPSATEGSVVIPIESEKTNVFLSFSVSPSDFLDRAEIVISLPKQWGCVPSVGWAGWKSKDGTPSTIWIDEGPTGTVTNEMVSFACQISSVFAGDGVPLPRLLITKIPLPNIDGAICIMAKVKDWPVEGLLFMAYFPRVYPPAGFSFDKKPFAIRGTNQGQIVLIPTNDFSK
jgi:hypothetical protein